MTMTLETVTLKDNPELVKQYIHIRHMNSAGHLPDKQITGDNDAKFILAMEGSTIRGGMRLSEAREDDGIDCGKFCPKGWMPPDKAPGAKLETLFPAEIAGKMRHREEGYSVLYVDGIVSNTSTMQALLGRGKVYIHLFNRLFEYAIDEKNYAMVYCFPKSNGNAQAIEGFYSRKKIPYVNLGPQPYEKHVEDKERAQRNGHAEPANGIEAMGEPAVNGHVAHIVSEGKSAGGLDRTLLLFFHDPQLLECVRKPSPDGVEAGAAIGAGLIKATGEGRSRR